MPDHHRRRRLRILLISFLAPACIIVAVALVLQRSTPELSPWHTVKLESEFTAADADESYDWEHYLATEDDLFRELSDKVVTADGNIANPNWNRYAEGGRNNPESFPRNWNRSYELIGEPGAGGALLIHGLTDSPYSLRRTAEILNGRGLHVVGLRLPGHGTTPAALQEAEVDDWRAAVRIACRHLEEVIGPSGQLILVGYSNGGALAIDYTLDSLQDRSRRCPDRVILYSPAIGITRAAALARAHHLLSFMPWFDRLGWSNVEPELDPFKYSSFPTDAGYQTHVLTRSVRRRLADVQNAEAASAFPPVLSFMSLADATVLVEAVISGLYDRLTGQENEIVIFDINRHAKMNGLYRSDPARRLQTLKDRPTTPYRLTLISDVDETTPTIEEWSRPPGTPTGVVTALELEWPRGFYSLSHVAVPFPPDDPVYGTRPDPAHSFGIQLGNLEPRGENGLLVMSPTQLTRLRSNPFFPYLERRLIGIVSEQAPPPPSTALPSSSGTGAPSSATPARVSQR